MQKPDRSSYTALDFIAWQKTDQLEISPQFQRREVWNRAAKSYLIDTLILGFPVPPLYLRVVQRPDAAGPVREVIDGQQRISAVLGYIANEYSLSKNIETPYTGQFFSDLPQDVKDSIQHYSFIAEVFYGVDDRDVLAIFARLNTNSVSLNAQELRNGRYFGPFKQSAYDLAFSHLTFWRRNGIFTELNIARMQEAELTSELVIAIIDGMQDKKKSIDSFYKRYDETYPQREEVESKFRRTIDEISESFGSDLPKTEFRRTPLFYSLFVSVAHRLFGIPKVDLPRKQGSRLTISERERLHDVVISLSEVIADGKNEDTIPEDHQAFVTASLAQTDNIRPRQTRVEHIYRLTFLN